MLIKFGRMYGSRIWSAMWSHFGTGIRSAPGISANIAGMLSICSRRLLPPGESGQPGRWFAGPTRSKLPPKRFVLRSVARFSDFSGEIDAGRGTQAGFRAGFIQSRHHDRQPVRLPDDRSEPRLWGRLPDPGDLLVRS